MAGGRTIIWGPQGQRLATDQTIKDETIDLLVEAFGYCTGLLIGQAKDQVQLELLMDESRQKIVKGVLMTEGTKEGIEARWPVRIGVTPDGQLTITAAQPMARPPGQPAANPYAEETTTEP